MDLWVLCALMGSSDLRATIGKLVIGAKVVDANGEKVSLSDGEDCVLGGFRYMDTSG